MALAWLANDWVRGRGGRVTALVVDHGLRAEAAVQARQTVERLAAQGLDARVLTLRGLERGSRLAEHARTARYAALEGACAGCGILHLLLGHHAADQAETVVMRMLAGSHASGLAAMAPLVETTHVRLLRPLLAIPPGRLRATLQKAGIDWVEDPSNSDPAAQRARLRRLRADADGAGPATTALVESAAARGRMRAANERALAEILAVRVAFHPAGFAILTPGQISPAALAATIAAVAGTSRRPPLRQVERIAANPGSATLGGVRILAAGRLASGRWLIAREPVAMSRQVAVNEGARWDGRFRLRRTHAGHVLGPPRPDVRVLRRKCGGWDLPAAVIDTLPVLHCSVNAIAGKTNDLYRSVGLSDLLWSPPMAAAGAGFGVPPSRDPLANATLGDAKV